MSDQIEGADIEAPSQEPKPNWITRCVNKIVSQYKKRAADNEKEKPQDRAARKTATATIWIAIFAAVTAGVGGAQWWVFSRQLSEMRASSEQASKLIQANVKLAEAAVTQADASKRAAAAAEASANALREAQRARVGPYEASLDNDPHQGLPTKLIIQFNNVGKEPALDAWYDAVPFLATVDEDASHALEVKMQANETECFAREPRDGAQIIYPSVGLGTQYTIKQDIDKSTISSIGGGNMLIVSGCFTYRTFGETHHTSFCYFYKSTMTDHSQLNICLRGNRAD